MNDVTLVTGGAGFVGRCLVEKLREHGERVRSFDLAAPSHKDDVQGSITNREEVSAALEGVSSVFHLAGNAQLWARDTTAFDLVNHRGTQIIADAARRAGVGRFIHCSSLTTLVGRETPIGHSHTDERASLSPASMLGAYPRSKLLAENAVNAAVTDGLDAVTVLPTEPLGAGDESMTPPTKMILDFANGATPAYIDCILNFVPVESLADGMMAARMRGRRGARYLLGGENIPMKKLLEMIERLSGRPAPKTKMPYWVALAAGAIDTGLVSRLTRRPPKAPLTGVRLAGRQVSFSSEKAANDLGWRAAPTEPALRQAFDWFSARGLLKPI